MDSKNTEKKIDNRTYAEMSRILRTLDLEQLDALKGHIADFRGMAEEKATKLAEKVKGLDPETIDHLRSAMSWREQEEEAEQRREKDEEEFRAVQQRNNDRLAAFICGGAAVIGSVVGSCLLVKGMRKLSK